MSDMQKCLNISTGLFMQY